MGVESVRRELKDGRIVLLRAVMPEDREVLREAFHRVSAETRMRRFLRDVGEPTDEMLRYLTEVDQHDHVAIWAVVESPDLKTEEPVGIARFVRLKDEPEVAEAAVTVVDAMQGVGVGGALLRRLVSLALERGITRFRSDVLATNEPMLHILEASGATLTAQGHESISFETNLLRHDGVPDSDTTPSVLLAVFGAIARALRV